MIRWPAAWQSLGPTPSLTSAVIGAAGNAAADAGLDSREDAAPEAEAIIADAWSAAAS
jgi:hypothetical protein